MASFATWKILSHSLSFQKPSFLGHLSCCSIPASPFFSALSLFHLSPCFLFLFFTLPSSYEFCPLGIFLSSLRIWNTYQLFVVAHLHADDTLGCISNVNLWSYVSSSPLGICTWIFLPHLTDNLGKSKVFVLISQTVLPNNFSDFLSTISFLSPEIEALGVCLRLLSTLPKFGQAQSFLLCAQCLLV